MSTPQPPSVDQLAAARLAHWRQNSAPGTDTEPGTSSAILTLDAARRFLSNSGLLLFSPRPQHISSPAPTFVEATLGLPNAAPSLAETAEARTLLTRLIAEGDAVPLNLLGAPSITPDAPDFIASAAVFPYIFTLRGDKAWKQPPSNSGAMKVSPLALNTYTLLLEHGPTSAYDLATHLGKEVTEAAVLRSLNELWQQLRVLPVPQPDSRATLWEPVANRFTKQLKAGANAGQPTALSALISLYLSQALLATEDEIETFLSPLAPRSRVRDVLHALTGARQLETLAIEGKTHLHIHGELPTFADPASTAVEAAQEDTSGAPAVELAEDGSRIKKFVPKPRKVGTGFVARPKPFAASGSPDRERRPFNREGNSRREESSSSDRPARRPAGKFGKPAGAPFQRPDRPARPVFNKPWDEEKQHRANRTAAPPSLPDEGSAPQFQNIVQDTDQNTVHDIDLDAAASAPPSSNPARGGFTGKRPFTPRPPREQDVRGDRGDRPARGPREDRGSVTPRRPSVGGDRPAFSRKPGFAGPTSSGRPAFPRDRDQSSSEGGPPRRDFTPRDGSGPRPPRRDSFGPKKPFGKPAFGDRGREGASDRPFSPRPPFGERSRPSADGGERRHFRRDSAPSEGRPPREFTPRDPGSDRPRRPFTPGGGERTGERPDRPSFRKFDAPRGPRKPGAPREDGDARPPRRDFASPGEKPSSAPKKSFGKPPFAGGRSKREGFAGKREGGFAGKQEGGFAGKKPFSARPAAPGSGGSTFDKFKGGNKPWGKRPPARKPRPDRGEA